MHARFLLLFLLLPWLGAPLSSASAQPTLPDHPVATAEAVQEAFVRVAEHVKPSVVTIVCETAPKPPAIAPKPGDKSVPKPPGGEEDDEEEPFNFSDPNEPRSSLGTGLVIGADGTILTNYHVVRGADVIRVLFDADGEKPVRAVGKMLGFDEESDLAVLQIARKNLPVAKFADSDGVRIGQWALAIGAPFDQPQSFTAGVISAKGRHLDKNGAQGLQDYLQTDASINPGNSGGPLINLDGEVIGINTAILSPSRFNIGIGFSVPSNTIKRLMPILLSGKSVQRGFLGIQYVRLDDDVAKEFGVAGGMQIGALAKRDGQYTGPAKEAGLREDDIITAVNGVPITSSEQFRSIVATTPPGTALKFAVTRPGTGNALQFETSVTLGNRETGLGTAATPQPAVARKAMPLGFGLEVASATNLTANERAKFGLTGKEKGVVILRIAPGSPADEADLKRGLRLMRARIEGTWLPVSDAATWQSIEKNALSSAKILVQLRDKDDVSVYKLLIAPEKPATGAVVG